MKQVRRLTKLAVFAIFCVASMAAGQQKPAPNTQNGNSDAKSAQPIKRLADGHPDLNGFWASGTGPDTPVGGFGAPDPGFRRGDNGARARLADPNQPPYKPELVEKVKELARNESKSDPAFFCKPGVWDERLGHWAFRIGAWVSRS